MSVLLKSCNYKAIANIFQSLPYQLDVKAFLMKHKLMLFSLQTNSPLAKAIYHCTFKSSNFKDILAILRIWISKDIHSSSQNKDLLMQVDFSKW